MQVNSEIGSMRFEERMGIEWVNDDMTVQQGPIISMDEHGVIVVSVIPLMPGQRCYGEGGSNEHPDNDIVRLKSCPGLFTEVREISPDGECGAIALAEGAEYIRFHDFHKQNVMALNGGLEISKQERADIIDNLWRDEKQKFLLMQLGVPTPEQVRAELERDATAATYDEMAGMKRASIADIYGSAAKAAEGQAVSWSDLYSQGNTGIDQAGRQDTVVQKDGGDAVSAKQSDVANIVPEGNAEREVPDNALRKAVVTPDWVGGKARADAYLKQRGREAMAVAELGDFSSTGGKSGRQIGE